MRNFRALLITLMMLKIAAWAHPQNPTVVAGAATLDSPSETLLNVTVADRSIISWDSFSIAASETTIFTLPEATATVLNRVVSDQPSILAGFLQSNGQVYLINQNGIVVTNNGVINTAGFLASTLDVLDTEFLSAEDMTFTAATEAAIVNKGSITAWNGDVVLIGVTVDNDHLIQAPNGTVAIGTGENILLTPGANEILSIQLAMPAYLRGKGITQNGLISALQAELKADGGLYGLAIQSEGIIQATSSQTTHGRIYLVASEGVVSVKGNLNATGFETTGGEIHVLGKTVTLLDRAQINASGDIGGGTILIGGSFQGMDPAILNAEQTYVDSNVKIWANATGGMGNGGEVVVWANGETYFYGAISAEAAPFSGDGGMVEVSGLNYLDFQGTVSTLAPNGITGTLLLDPTNITIQATGPTTASFGMPNCAALTYCGGSLSSAVIMISDLLTQLLSNNIIVDSSTGTGVGLGTVTVASPLTIPLGSFNLTVNARAGFTVSATGSITNNSSSTIAINVANGASGGLSMQGNVTNASNGNIDITCGMGGSTVVSIQATLSNTSSGNITCNVGTSVVNSGTFDISAGSNLINSGSGNVAVNVIGNGSVAGVNISGSISHTSTGTLQLITAPSGFSLFNTASVNIGAGAGAVTFSGSTLGGVSFSGGSITSAASSSFQLLSPGDKLIINGTSMSFTGGSPVLFQAAGGGALNTITLNGPMSFSGGTGPLQILAEGAISIGGSLTYSNSMLATIQSSGSTVTTSGSFNISGSGGLQMNAATALTVGGSITYTSTSPLTLTGNNSIRVNAPIDMATAAALTLTTTMVGSVEIGNLVTNSGIGTITVNTGTMSIGSSSISSNAQLGSAGGDVMITAAGDVILHGFGASFASTYAQIGYHTGDIDSDITFVSIGGNLTLYGGPEPSCYAVIGHGSQQVGATGGVRNGNITFGPIAGSVQLISFQPSPDFGANPNSFAQIGHMRSLTGTAVTATGDIDLTQITGSVTLTGSKALGNYAMIGHGGSSSPQSDSFSGNVQVHAGGTVELTAGEEADAFAAIGQVAILTAPGTVTLQADTIEAISGGSMGIRAQAGAEALIGMYAKATAVGGQGSITAITPMTLPSIDVQTGMGADLVLSAATPSDSFNGVLIGFLSYTGAIPFVAAGDVGGTVQVTTGDDLILEAGSGGSSNNTFAYILNGLGTPAPDVYDITLNIGGDVLITAGNNDAGILSLDTSTLMATGLLRMQATDLGEARIETNNNLDITTGAITMNTSSGGQAATIQTLAGDMTIISGLTALISNGNILSGGTLDMTLSNNLFVADGSSISSVGAYVIDVRGSVNLFSAASVIITGTSTGDLTATDNIFILADESGSAEITAASTLNVSSTAGSIYLIGFTGQIASIHTSGSTIAVTANDSISLLHGSVIAVGGGTSDLTVTAMTGSLLVDNDSSISNFGTGFLDISGGDVTVRGLSNISLIGSGTFTLDATTGNMILENGARIQNLGTMGISSSVAGSLLINGGPLGESILLAGTGGVVLSANEIVMNGFSPSTQATITAQAGPLTLSSTLAIALDANSRISLTGGSGAYQLNAGTTLNVSGSSVLNNQSSGMTTVTAAGSIAFLEGSSLQGSSGAVTVQSMNTLELIDGSFITGSGTISLLSMGNLLLSSSFAQSTNGILNVQTAAGNVDLINGSSLRIMGGSSALTATAMVGNLTLNNASFIQNNGTGVVTVTSGADGLIRAGSAGPSFISGKNSITVNVTDLLVIEASSGGRSYIVCPGTESITAGVLEMIGYSATNPALIQNTAGVLTVQADSISMQNFSQITTTAGAAILTVDAIGGDLNIINGSFIQHSGTGAVQSTNSGHVWIAGGPAGASKIQSGNGGLTLSAEEITLNGFSSAFNALVTSAQGSLTLTSTLSTSLSKHAQITLTSAAGAGILQLNVGGDLLIANDTLIRNYGTGIVDIDAMGSVDILAGAGNVTIQAAAGGIQITAAGPLVLLADVNGFVSVLSSGNISLSSMGDILLAGSSGSSNSALVQASAGSLTILSDNLTLRDKAITSITSGAATLSVTTLGDLNIENGSSIAHTGTGAVTCIAAGNLFLKSGLSGSAFIAGNAAMNLMITQDIGIEAANGFSSYTSSKGATIVNADQINLNGVNGSAPAQIKNTTGVLTINADSLNLVNFGQILLSGAGVLTVNAAVADLRVTNGSMIAQQGTGNVSSTVDGILFIEGGPLGLASLTASGNVSVNASEIFLTGFSSTNSAQISSSQGSLNVTSTTMTSLNPFAKIAIISGALPYILTVGSDLLVANGSFLQRGGTGTMAINVTGAASLIGGAADSSITGNTGALNVSVGGVLRLLSDIQGKAFITSAGNTTVSSGADILVLGALEAALQAYIQTTAGTLSVTAADNLKLYDLGAITITAGVGTLTANVTNGDLFLENGSSIQQKGTGAIQSTVAGNLSVKSGWAGSSSIASGAALTVNVGEDVVVEAVSGFAASVIAKGVTSITASRLLMDGFSSIYTANITNTTGNLTVTTNSFNLLNFSNIKLSGGAGILQVDANNGYGRITNGSFIQNQGSGAFNINVDERLFLTGGSAGAASILGGSAGVTVTADSILMGGTTNANQGAITSTLGTLAVNAAGMLNMTPFSKIQLTSGPNNVNVTVVGTLYRADNTTISTLGTGMVNIMAGSTIICHP